MKSSPAVRPAPCTVPEAYRGIDTKDENLLRIEHKISPGRVTSITDTLRIMTDWEVQRVWRLGDDFQYECCPCCETSDNE